MPKNTPEITVNLVQQLINEQFPEWANLTIRPVSNCGWDNKTFHLGNKLILRLPSKEEYAAQVEKEQKWLPLLQDELSIQIPIPIAMGMPSTEYPWRWSVYQWLEGKSVNLFSRNELNLLQIATELANFLNELHKINSHKGPEAGLHNFYRGAHPSIYSHEAERFFAEKLNAIHKAHAEHIWQHAIGTKWLKNDVWVHGDISSGNLLLNNQVLTAVIDFGCLGVGDPACDLMIAWTLFDKPTRACFKNTLLIDENTWARGKAWALWKCLQDSGPEAKDRARILQEIFND